MPALTSLTSPLLSRLHIFTPARRVVTSSKNVFITKSHGWSRLHPSLCLPLCLRVGFSLRVVFREILLYRCVNQDSGVSTSALCVKYRARRFNFAPGVQTLTVIWERNSCSKDILRNTWAHRYGKCTSTSVNGSVWTLTLKFRPTGSGLCRFCGLAFMVGALGKLILKRCLRAASTETDGIFYSAISVVFI